MGASGAHCRSWARVVLVQRFYGDMPQEPAAESQVLLISDFRFSQCTENYNLKHPYLRITARYAHNDISVHWTFGEHNDDHYALCVYMWPY